MFSFPPLLCSLFALINLFTDEGKSFDVSYQRLDGVALDVSRFWSMLVKKAIHTWRNRVMSVIQLALPVIFTILALCIDKVCKDR